MLAYQSKIAPSGQVLQVQQVNRQGDSNAAPPVVTKSHAGPNCVSSSLMDHKIAARTIGLACTLGPVIMLPMYFADGLRSMFRGGAVCIAFIFLPMSMYIGKKHLRKTLWREFKSMW